MNRTFILNQLADYSSSFPEELLFVARFKTLLTHPRCFYRDHLPGHITGSAWIINHVQTKVLLLKHTKLNKWLQPGGHADGNENILDVSKKEVREETGIQELKLMHQSIFDIDIHSIPARNNFPEHLHYDIRFLFITNETAPLKINHESRSVKWISLTDIEEFTQEKSILRMKQKLFLPDAIWK